MSDKTDQMAVAGATLLGLAALTKGGGSPVPPPPVPPVPPNPPNPVGQQMRDGSGIVTNTGRQIFGPNAKRQCLLIVNDGDDVLYICFSVAPAIHTGMRLNSLGGAMVIDQESMWYGPVSAIALSEDTNIVAVEVYGT